MPALPAVASLRSASVILAVALVALAAAAALPAHAETPSQDPLAVGPTIYKAVLDNERVRILEATFAPGARIGIHAHPDHAAYVLEGGTLNITGTDGKVQVYELKAGQAVWLPAQAHAAENPGKTPVRVLVVELKEPAPRP
jgi:quercetin dioxygenase-like cupin family protein